MREKFNNKIILLLLILVIIVLSTTFALAKENIYMKIANIDEWINQQIIIKKGENNNSTVNNSFYDKCRETINTRKQEESFERIISDLGYGEWKRDVLILIGDLPKDTPRITLKDAESLVAKNMTENDYIMALNNIAGAPDWQGGSGIGRAIYYLDEEHNESIIVMSNSIMYVVYDEKGNSIEKPIGDQVVPSPKPTQAKKN